MCRGDFDGDLACLYIDGAKVFKVETRTEYAHRAISSGFLQESPHFIHKRVFSTSKTLEKSVIGLNFPHRCILHTTVVSDSQITGYMLHRSLIAKYARGTLNGSSAPFNAYKTLVGQRSCRYICSVIPHEPI